MAPIRAAFLLYQERFLLVLTYSIAFAVPIYYLNGFYADYLISSYEIFKFIPGGFFRNVFMMLAISVVQIPFIELVRLKTMGKKASLKDGVRSLLDHIFPVYVMSLVYLILVSVGFVFLVFPGIVILILFMFFPQTAVIEGLHWWKGFKRASMVAKQNFFKLLLIVLLLGLFELVVQVMIGILLSNPSIVIEIILMIFAVPLQGLIMTFFYLKWTGNFVASSTLPDDSVNARGSDQIV